MYTIILFLYLNSKKYIEINYFQGGRFGKFDNELCTDFSLNSTSYKSLNHKQSNDDNSMMEVILKSTTTDSKSKMANGHHGSTSNLAASSGGLPGIRGRTRQSISGTSGTNGSQNGINMNGSTTGVGKMFTTDTEEDETVDFLLKSAMTVPKGQPPKKRTKKYGDRKSCKNFNMFFINLI